MNVNNRVRNYVSCKWCRFQRKSELVIIRLLSCAIRLSLNVVLSDKSGASSRNNCTLVKQAASGNMTHCCCCCCIVYHLINCICLSFLCVVNLMWTLAIRCWNPCEIGKLNSLTFTLYFMHIVDTDTFIYTAQYTYRCQVCSFCWWEEVQYLLIAAVNSFVAFVVLFM